MRWIEKIAEAVFERKIEEHAKNIDRLKEIIVNLSNNSDDLKERVEILEAKMISLDVSIENLDSIIKFSLERIKKENQVFYLDSDKQLSDNVKEINTRAFDLRDRVREFEEIKQRMDDGLIMMTRKDLDKFINNRLSLFEGGIDDKIVGLYRSVDDKLSKGNGKVTDVANLMKKIAVLEGVKDAIEHRVPVKDVIDKIKEFKRKMVDLDRNDAKYDRYKDAIQLLGWTLGEEKI